MLNLISEKEVKSIVKSVSSAINSGDINKLTKAGYDYLYPCSGFIAHYNIHGFKCHYQNTDDLKNDLIRYKDQNQWNNFSPRDKDYRYYWQKREIYNYILKNIADLFVLA